MSECTVVIWCIHAQAFLFLVIFNNGSKTIINLAKGLSFLSGLKDWLSLILFTASQVFVMMNIDSNDGKLSLFTSI